MYTQAQEGQALCLIKHRLYHPRQRRQPRIHRRPCRTFCAVWQHSRPYTTAKAVVPRSSTSRGVWRWTEGLGIGCGSGSSCVSRHEVSVAHGWRQPALPESRPAPYGRAVYRGRPGGKAPGFWPASRRILDASRPHSLFRIKDMPARTLFAFHPRPMCRTGLSESLRPLFRPCRCDTRKRHGRDYRSCEHLPTSQQFQGHSPRHHDHRRPLRSQ